ncbi:MAG: HAD family phosphatase [Tissierellia bacterium]|nr:HAD family phosphatase [Tissierellia bacterium]
MIKLIVLDIDGTLVNDDKEITERTKSALIKAQKMGIKLAIASGRAPEGIRRFAEELDFDKYENFISAQNGTILVDFQTKEVLANHLLDYEDAKRILKFVKGMGLSILIYHDNKVYTDNISNYLVKTTVEENNGVITEKKDLLDNLHFTPNNIVFTGRKHVLEPAMEKIGAEFGEVFDMVLTSGIYYEAMPQGISKATSLKDIADIYGIDVKDTLAFGDSDNDLQLIKEAGIGVAMANATENVLEVADYITLNNNEDGIADYLERYVFDKQD